MVSNPNFKIYGQCEALIIIDDTEVSLHSSFPVMHKVGNVDIFLLPKFEKNMTDREIAHIN